MTESTSDVRYACPLTPTILGLIALAGFGPLLAQFFYNLWQFDTYQFFPLALAGGAFLIARGVQEARRPLKPGGVWLRIPLILAVLGVLASAAVMAAKKPEAPPPAMRMRGAFMGFRGPNPRPVAGNGIHRHRDWYQWSRVGE